MASLNNVEIKSLKWFRGHEGEECFQGTVYYNGKKLGSWSQSGTGGGDLYDFDIQMLDLPVYRWKAKIKDYKYSKYADVDVFMMTLAGIITLEHEFKKNLKKSLPYLAYSINNTDGVWSCVPSKTYDFAKRNMERTFSLISSRYNKEDLKFIETNVASSLEDFEFIMGSVEEGKKEKERAEIERKKAIQEYERKETEKIAKEKEKEKLQKSRFNVKDTDGPYKIIEDKITGKSTKIASYAYPEVMNALLDFFF